MNNIDLDKIFTEEFKAKLASEHSKSRSEGNQNEDRNSYFDFLSGIEKAVEILKQNGKLPTTR